MLQVQSAVFDHIIPRVMRRYIATNMFDGSLLAMGVIASSMILELSPRETIVSGLVIGFSSVVSGFSGAFLVESAELTRELRELEKHLFAKLRVRAGTVGLLLSTVNALSTPAPVFVALMPFAFAELQLLTVEAARLTALLVVFTLLFMLGVFLGRLAQENPLKYGAMTVLSGALVAAVDLLLHP